MFSLQGLEDEGHTHAELGAQARGARVAAADAFVKLFLGDGLPAKKTRANKAASAELASRKGRATHCSGAASTEDDGDDGEGRKYHDEVAISGSGVFEDDRSERPYLLV
ncbi:hypothetical protein PHLGIDRAFT_352181 [Phlebiopsis gigantea 11061_1 CR5-6]|uniref:Uncharacterized protein n=1 Tax=Phlebiopsis gigantea (strain 11061_1 CR5-6) TaxID=745531 RepID=A0A0C3NUQ3_PHLG1|nr:hypothetical protein PHLGIDRAFT_352181 [Phlebiopsis gigantea 11061_1 CR5-6]